ncbi:MAG TPA: NusG domain II-containing protein [Firmicutes bacterium]|nr:NusG domain II-containing protein [Bacillota bacterium]
MLKKGDILVITIFITLALTGFAISAVRPARYTPAWVVIEVGGKEYLRLPVSGRAASRTIRITASEGIPADYNVVQIKDGRARILESNCPGKVCVKTGWISRPGQSIVCVPHRLVVRIQGNVDKAPGDPDIVAY